MASARKLFKKAPRSLITTPLAAAFVLSCLLLGRHASSGQPLEYNVAGELLLVAVLSLEGIVAVRHLQQSRLDSVHQVLVEILEDFRSAEMMMAIVALWRFRIEHGEKFVSAYLARWQEDDERIARLPEGERLAALSGTIHYHRRVAKEFYNLLGGLYELGVLPAEILYTYWSEADLKILPDVLIPLEAAVAQKLRHDDQTGGWHRRLQRLYDDRPR
jgi:hypothetical protein